MKVRSRSVALLLAFLIFGPSNLGAMPFLPDFSVATFIPGSPVNNSYFPLVTRVSRTYVGQKEESGEIITEGFELSNTGPGPTILGVQTTIQRDRSFEDGVIVEDTFDYYAQDTTGNVWYFGEDVTNFVYDNDGNLIDTNSSSSWRGGVNDALPGFIMPADLIEGFNYRQEFAPNDDPVDEATIFSLGNTVSLSIGDFTNVLQTFEENELDPDAREFKYYAPGEGLILVEEGLNSNLADPEIQVELVSTVPEPSTVLLMGSGFIGMAAWRYRKGTKSS
ncbi:MAG: PEP-CTERM sorting domain-containing protein [Nitrospirales bacterium]